MFKRPSLSLEQALQKLRHYCGYQTRCHQEVKEKLYSFGLRKQEVETAIATLIEEDYLNEERFAIHFASGHFRLKQWGKVKIRYELKQKQVGEFCIKKALAAIGDEDYRLTLSRLAGQKWESLQAEVNPFSKKRKIQDFLLQKGYEHEMIGEAIKNVSLTS